MLKKLNEKADVLEKITLIKDISLSNPHIAHIKNLESIASIAHREVDEYYKAILEALSIEKSLMIDSLKKLQGIS